jgi:hypothetical protein
VPDVPSPLPTLAAVRTLGLDRVYEDRLSDAIPEELWNSKSAALQDELRQVRTEMERHEVASQAYETAGLQILELAQTAYSYGGQRIFVVQRDDYVYLVPFVEDDKLIALKTIIPSRKATKRYLEKEPDDHEA